MDRIAIPEREDWKATAEQNGFSFHSLDGDPYWDESLCYKFSLRQIEDDLEDPVEELEQFCFEVVERAVNDEEVLKKLAVPELFWQPIADSWADRERNLYGRMDFVYDGQSPAKLLEYNADTPTSLFEASIFQWVWLEQAMERGIIPPGCDQFNSLHERLQESLSNMGIPGRLHFACAKDSTEDRATVAYLEDVATQAGLETRFLYMEDLGLSPDRRFTDTEDEAVTTLFKLYPWEWMMAEDFGAQIPDSGCTFIEPLWKSLLSNKGLLPLLWEMYEGHPNLLPAYFEGDPRAADLGGTFVKKPLFSREGWDITLVEDGAVPHTPKVGPYGEEGFVLQAYHPLPDFDGFRPVCGVWLVASQAAGMGMREDNNWVTSDDARFVPHVIAD
ncbi:glutathionylspermidine synthase family protein [Magnetospira sp. QH-2]|uniref:glutathionylspermidine synthase family protein n=1 Tax=Magnetospira sp. (strain QH-2) TaxID=1288970 RepID=UPI0003E8103E|nr:glutathionylspermidine synthase family protein [Magnetospira sp. QH-2]CCQ73392.1 Putative Glutathionylspermidine synthase family protein [Magnetospira sp. QH-2]